MKIFLSWYLPFSYFTKVGVKIKICSNSSVIQRMPSEYIEKKKSYYTSN